jgi:predicted TPR repeat methyltransferase
VNRKERRAQRKPARGTEPQISSDSVERLFLDGLNYHQTGHLKEAERNYRRVLDINPDHTDCLNLLGLAAHQSGDSKSAARLFSKAIKQNPSNALYQNNYGCVLKGLGQLDNAEAAYRAALRVAPDYAEAHFNLGNVLILQGRNEEAIAALNVAIKLNPGWAEAYNNLGTTLRDTKRWEEAAAAFTYSIRLKPDNPEAYYNLGHLLESQSRYDEAVKAFNSALLLRPDFADAHNNLGLVLKKLRAIDAAVKAFNAAIALSPRHADAHKNLGDVLQVMGKPGEAVGAYQAAIRIRPKFWEAHKGLGAAYYSLRRFDEALSAFRRGAALGDVSSDHLARALEGKTTKTAPQKYVVELFDGCAEHFEQHLTSVLQYNAPELLKRLIENTHPGTRFSCMGDLGCGTGLAGVAFRPIVGRIVGVDLSSKMVELARGKGVYDELIVGEISETLTSLNTHFDLFVLADVLVYIGELDSLFRVIKDRSITGARLAFSVEPCQGDQFQLLPSGRYGHSLPYLKKQLDLIGASIIAAEEDVIRYESGEPVLGNYVVAALS